MGANPMNGRFISRKHQAKSGTIFIPLPRALWTVSLDGKCACHECAKLPQVPAYWDTLAVSVNPTPGKADVTWVVHYPEVHRVERNHMADEIDRQRAQTTT